MTKLFVGSLTSNRTPDELRTIVSNRAASVALRSAFIRVPAWIGGTLFHANFIEIQLSQTCQAISSNDHIVLILMYRRTSSMDITKTYPAKISPAVPRTFQTSLNVLIAPTFWPNRHPALMLSAPKRKCFSRCSRFRQTTSTCPAYAAQFFHSLEEVAAKLIPLTREKSAKQNIGGVKTRKPSIVPALHDLAKLHRLCRSRRQT